MGTLAYIVLTSVWWRFGRKTFGIFASFGAVSCILVGTAVALLISSIFFIRSVVNRSGDPYSTT